MRIHCKHNYTCGSSILTVLCENIASMKNWHLRMIEVMEEQGLQAPDVARICGFKTPHAVYQWLDGTTKNLKMDNLYAFCLATETHIEWLISGIPPKHKPKTLRKLEENFEKLGKRDQSLLCRTSDDLAEPDKNEGFA